MTEIAFGTVEFGFRYGVQRLACRAISASAKLLVMHSTDHARFDGKALHRAKLVGNLIWNIEPLHREKLSQTFRSTFHKMVDQNNAGAFFLFMFHA